MVYDTQAGNTRTDSEFRNFVDKIHHHNLTPWATCPFIIDLIWQFPADPMHLIDLGVMKKKLELLLALHLIDLAKAEQLIKDTKPYLPDDFTRKVRTLEELKNFKATEYRFFGLYFGPVLFLKCCISEEATKHFLKFFVAYRLLMGKTNFVSKEDLTVANLLLQAYVEEYPSIYGSERVGSNIHTLLHLSEMVENHGSLDNFSCYKYENFYQMLRQWIRKPDQYFTQIMRRWVQTKGATKMKSKSQKKFDSNLLQSNNKDSCVLLTDNSIFLISKIKRTLTGTTYEGQHFLKLDNLFIEPIKSSDLQIYIVSDLSDKTTINHENISKKLIRFPWEDNSWVVMPIIHSKFQ